MCYSIQLEMTEGAADGIDTSQLFPIEFEIVKSLHAAGVDLSESSEVSNTVWTARIKDALSNLASKRDLLQFPSQSGGTWAQSGETWETGGEWLFDVVWVKGTTNSEGKHDWRNCSGLALACESEWTMGQYSVLEDFFKLTFAVADLRLFIYTNPAIDEDHPVDMCRRVCPLSRGFRYLAIGFPGSKSGKCRVDAWTA